MLFFVTLWFRRESLYSPGDFRDDTSFLHLIRKLETLEVKQEAAQFDPRGDPNAALSVIKRLIKENEINTAIHFWLAFLKVKRYESSQELFHYLKHAIPKETELHYKAKEYHAYSLIGLGKYSEAIEELNQLLHQNSQTFGFWPSLALAYAHYKLGNETESKKWIHHLKQQKYTSDIVRLVEDIYPELVEQLQSSD